MFSFHGSVLSSTSTTKKLNKINYIQWTEMETFRDIGVFIMSSKKQIDKIYVYLSVCTSHVVVRRNFTRNSSIFLHKSWHTLKQKDTRQINIFSWHKKKDYKKVDRALRYV